MIIKLDAEEMRVVKLLAEQRNGCKTEAQNMRYCSHSDVGLHVVGLMGELAVAKLLGTKIDQRTLKHGDDGDDLMIGERSIQVKTCLRDRPGMDLYFNDIGKFASDIAVLVLARGKDEVRVAGWIPRNEFEFLLRHKDYGYGDRITVPECWLRGIWELTQVAQGGNEG